MPFDLGTAKIIFISAAISAALVLPVERLCRVLLIIDHPSQRGVHHHPVSRAGGIVLLLALIVSILALSMIQAIPLAISPEHFRLLSLLSVIVVVGLLDDRFDLKWSLKLSLHMLLALMVVASSSSLGIVVTTPADRIQHFVFYLVAVNAINLVDGLNGLCLSICLLSLTALLFLCGGGLSNASSILIFLPILIGVLLGALYFNVRNPAIFLGESGALLLGFLLTILFNNIVQTRNYALSDRYFMYALIFGHPLIEVVSTSARRFIQGYRTGKGFIRSILSIVVADANHLHHRVLEKNNSETKTVAVLCALHAGCILPIFIFYF